MRSLLILLFLTTSLQAQLVIKVSSFPPGKKLEPGVAAIISVEGLQGGQKVLWHHSPVEGDVTLQFGDKMLFGGTTKGMRTFVVQVPQDGADPFVVRSFQYGDNDETPNPTPQPPTPGEVEGVVILYESKTKTQLQTMCLNGLQLYLNEKDYFWAIRDKDIKDGLTNKTPDWMIPYLRQAKGQHPALILKLGEGAGYQVYELTVTAEEAIDIIQMNGG